MGGKQIVRFGLSVLAVLLLCGGCLLVAAPNLEARQAGGMVLIGAGALVAIAALKLAITPEHKKDDE